MVARPEETTTDPRWRRLWRWVAAHRWNLLALFVTVLLPLLLFGVLAEDVAEQERVRFDTPLLLVAHAHASPILDRAMLLLSRLGYLWGVVPIDIAVVLLLFVRGRRADALFVGLAVGGAAALNQAAKWVFTRQRPALWPSIAPEATFSFPSGHAMGSMALSAALIVLAWPTRWRYVAVVLGSAFTLLVGMSRVYLGVHYPSDVLAGWAASLAWVMGLSSILYGRLGKPASAPADAPPSQVPQALATGGAPAKQSDTDVR